MIILRKSNITIEKIWKNNPCEISVKIRKKFNQLDKSKKKKGKNTKYYKIFQWRKHEEETRP